ncbi:MAG: TonB family protein, partial [Myxococcota bacterium]
MILWLMAIAWAGEPVLPALVSTVPAVYPASELASGRAAAVVLRIDVDDTGAVIAVEVVESAGPAFDAAAVQAARSFRVTPGLDPDGRAPGASILYRTTFEPTLAPAVSVTGRVRSAGTRTPLAGVDVGLTRGDARVVATTDAEGQFSVAGLAAGRWVVTLVAPGYRDEPLEIEVVDGEVVELGLFPVEDRPWEVAAPVSEEITVVGRRIAPEVTERRLSQEEVRYLPGTAGDVVRVVQNLPGVARPPLGIGQLVIRGTAPEDSAYYLDGAPIPNVFHFAGFSTVLNGDAIDEIAFLPGNYGVRYGRTIGGVVDLRVADELPERSRGYVSVDLFQTTAFAEQRLGRASLTVSGRRSYVDAVLNPILNGSGATTIRAPRYYDFQARMFGETRSGGTFDALFLLSDDRFRVVGTDADDEEEVQIGLTTTFTKLRLQSRESLGGPWRNEASMIAGPERQAFAFGGDGEAYEQPFTVAMREEVLRPAPSSGLGWGLRVGTDTQVGSYRYSYDVPGFGDPEGGDVVRFLPSVYAEPTARLGALELVPGLRVDGAVVGSDWRTVMVDPRLSARVDATASTAFEASVGGYSQLPTVRQVIDEPSLGPVRSWQTSVGIEQRLGPDWTIELTGYDNWLTALVSGREDAFRFFSGPPPIGPLDTGAYANDGTGRIYGVEGLVRLATERTAALVSVTVGRSSRIDRPGDPTALFEYDQPWVATALASRELPRRWRLGARIRGSSGNPYTPVVNRLFDLGTRQWIPVYAPEVDGERLPAFASVDVRVDKDWVYRNWTLTLYVDVQNATNRQNVEVMSWSDDYSEETPITGLPLVLHEEDMRLSGRGVAHEGAVASRLGLAGIPPISESIAVARDAVLAEYEDGHIHICHVSASETVDEVRRAKERGVRITAEVTPHHLALT